MAVNPITLLDGTTAYAADVETKVNPLYTDIDNSNIAAGAGIIFSKLDAATVMGIAAVQTVTGAKTFAATTLLVAGAGAGITTLAYENTANDQTATIPYVGASAEFVMNPSAGNVGPLAPLGSIIPFYNYGLDGGAAPAISIDTNYWHFCDGTAAVTFGDGETRDIPDLSNRYLVGFGTEGGGDIGTADWIVGISGTATAGGAAILTDSALTMTVNEYAGAYIYISAGTSVGESRKIISNTADTFIVAAWTTPTDNTSEYKIAWGNPNSATDLSHAHTNTNHNHDTDIGHGHTVGSITASMPAHYHGKGSLAIDATTGAHVHTIDTSWNTPGSGTINGGGATPATGIVSTTAGAGWDGLHAHANSAFTGSVGATGGSNGDTATACTMGGSVTPLVSTVTSGGASALTMDSQLSITQDIQPRSVRVRYIMRIK